MTEHYGSQQFVRGYQDLRVWQLGMEISKEIYRFTSTFPGHEQFGMTSQLRRAATSIPANIAEGHSRGSTKEYLRFLSIALGSLAECETFVLLSEDLSYARQNDSAKILAMLGREGRMLRSLQNSLRRKSPKKPRPK